MKKIILILPFAVLAASCSTQRDTTTSTGAGATGSVSAAGMGTPGMAASGSVGADASPSASQGNMATSSSSMSTSASSRYKGYDINKYDPNNYMQNPDKYKSPSELAKTGGWTYNTEWNHNTNFLAEALGEWLLAPTPEVAAFWIPDSSRADSYAAYWTPEAVAAREQERMMAQAAYNDSVARTQGWSGATASTGKRKAGMKNKMNATAGGGSTGTVAAGGISGTASSTADISTSAGTATTSDMNSQGLNSPQTVSNTKNYLMAVNGNMFQAPRLNLYLQNGTFVGYTGSNQLVGTLKVNGTQLRFDPTMPSTNMEATGGFSQAAFMERLNRVDSYDITDGQLRLKQGNEVLFVLAKNSVR